MADEGSVALAMPSTLESLGAAAGALGAAAPPESGASCAQIDPVRRPRLAMASPIERVILERIVHLRPAGLESSAQGGPPSRGDSRCGRTGRGTPGTRLDARPPGSAPWFLLPSSPRGQSDTHVVIRQCASI